MVRQESDQILLCVLWEDWDLIHSGLDLAVGEQVGEKLSVEV